MNSIFNKPLLIDKNSLEAYNWSIIAQNYARGIATKDRFGFKETYKIVGGVAIIEILGAIEQRPSIFQIIFGGTSTEVIREQLLDAIENENVISILLNIDSPGGTVDDISSLSNEIFAAREKKRIISVVNHMAASAAYWLASSASEVILAGETAIAGSIGVRTLHRDFSELENKIGIKSTEIVAGKFKDVGSPFRPLEEEGRKVLQEQVDKIYSVFLSAIARNRQTTVQNVIEDMAEGRIFIGSDAVKAGLVDGISTFDAILSAEQNISNTGGNMDITLEIIKSNAPELLREIEAKAVDKFMSGIDSEFIEQNFPEAANTFAKAGEEDGVNKERERISKINDLNWQDDEARKEAINSGKSYAEACIALAESMKNVTSKISGDAPPALNLEANTESTKEEQRACRDRMLAIVRERSA